MDPEELFHRYAESGDPDKVLAEIARREERAFRRREFVELCVDLTVFFLLLGAVWAAIWLMVGWF